MNKHEARLREFIEKQNLTNCPCADVVKAIVKHEFGSIRALDMNIPRNLPDRFSDLVFEDHAASTYLLQWPPGNPGTEIHDHGKSRGAVIVIRGIVKETVYGPAAGRDLVLPQSFELVRMHHPGSVIELPEGYIHKFEDGTDGREALSLHLYEPALTYMNYYVYNEDSRLLVQEGGWKE